MIKLNWQDKVRYQQGKVKVYNSATINVLGITIELRRHFAYLDTEWVLYSQHWDTGCILVCSGTLDEAKELSETILKNKLINYLAKFD